MIASDEQIYSVEISKNMVLWNLYPKWYLSHKYKTDTFILYYIFACHNLWLLCYDWWTGQKLTNLIRILDCRNLI